MSEPAHGATVLRVILAAFASVFLEAGPVHSVGAMESMRFLTLRQVIAEGLVLVAGKGLLKGWTCSDRRQKLSSKV
jgi:hypothetical protein